MSVTYQQMLRLPRLETITGLENAVVHHGGTFFNIQIRDLVQHHLQSIEARLDTLEQSPIPTYWPERQSIFIEGDVTGHGQWDGSTALRLNLSLQDSFKMDRIEGLSSRLLGLHHAILARVKPDGHVATAGGFDSPQVFHFRGDLRGDFEVQGGMPGFINARLSDELYSNLDNRFHVIRPGAEGPLESVTVNGAFARFEPTGHARERGVLWNMYDAEQDVHSQLVTGFDPGHFWLRTSHQGKSAGWERVWTSATFDPSQFANKRATFSITETTQDMGKPSAASVVNWNRETLNGFENSGTYLEFNSAGSNRALAMGNTIHRLSISDQNRARIHVSRDGGDFVNVELWTTANFDPSRKADRTHPVFNRAVQVYTVEQTGTRPVLELGWNEGQPHWVGALEADGSLTINARSLDGQQTHRLIEFHSALNSGTSKLDVNVPSVRIGVERNIAMYGYHIDDWGTLATADYIAWGKDGELVTFLDKTTYLLSHNGRFLAGDSVGGTRVFANWDAGIDGGMSCDNWFRSSGMTGWQNSTYGGGWFMRDLLYMRSLDDKMILASGYSLRYEDTAIAIATPLEFNGYLRPIQFISALDGEQHAMLDPRDIHQKYPFAVDAQNRAVHVSHVHAILSAQINHQDDRMQALERRVNDLEAQLERALAALGSREG